MDSHVWRATSACRFLLVSSILASWATRALAEEPDFGPDGKVLAKAVVAEDAGRTDAAIELYNEFIGKHSGVPGAYYYLGNLYLDTGRQDEAAGLYRRGKAARPG